MFIVEGIDQQGIHSAIEQGFMVAGDMQLKRIRSAIASTDDHSQAPPHPTYLPIPNRIPLREQGITTSSGTM